MPAATSKPTTTTGTTTATATVPPVFKLPPELLELPFCSNDAGELDVAEEGAAEVGEPLAGAVVGSCVEKEVTTTGPLDSPGAEVCVWNTTLVPPMTTDGC